MAIAGMVDLKFSLAELLAACQNNFRQLVTA